MNFRTIPLFFVFVALWPVSGLQAAESPDIRVSVLTNMTISTVTSNYSAAAGFRPHIRFPGMDRREDGTLRIWMNVGQTQGVSAPGKNFKSFDDGQSWSEVPNALVVTVTRILAAGQTSWGVVPDHNNAGGFTTWTSPRYQSTDGGDTWSQVANAQFNNGGVSYLSLYGNIGEVVEVAGSHVMTAFGVRQGSTTFELVLFATTDAGANWTRRATVAQHVSGVAASMGIEGPNEGDIVRLDNGDLLSVFRTGQPFPTEDVYAVAPSIFWSISGDDGFTWSSPKMLGTAGQQVQLRKLPDGTVAMSYGRYGCKLMFADPTGRRWTEPAVIYDGPTDGTVDLELANDGTYAYSYAQSSFYNLSFDPDVHQVSWSPLSFADGLEIEFRAREVSGTTLQSAAIVQVGDGTGILAVEIIGSGVQLQGINGNAGQQVYSFDSGQWTTYRLDVAPDPGDPAEILAELYVNGVLRLTNAPDPVVDINHVRIGDVTGSNNGTWDLDWLRFRDLGGAQWALEYDGDVLPDQLAEAWTKVESGGGVASLLSGGGTDYLRMDTGPNGLPVSLYYSLVAGAPAPPDGYRYTENGAEIAHMKVARLSITNVPASDPFDWALEYHGDVSPDTLPVAWTETQLGSVDQFLWADDGQDYLRIDTGGSGLPARLYYDLFSGTPGSEWAAMDFNEGVAAEFRARVGDTNLAEGVARILLGDGANGYVLMELTGTDIRLEGEGGNAEEEVLTIDTTQWHTYRLVVGPDPSFGNKVRAQVFLDGMNSSAVLTNLPNPAATFDQIQFGDVAGSDNGSWDLDFLRFASRDADADGMPDDWEHLHFGNWDAGPLKDPDGDYLSNVNEYQAGTIPTNDASVFAVSTEVEDLGASVRISWASEPDRFYAIAETTDLENGPWTVAAGFGHIAATPPVNVATIPANTSVPTYYRVELKTSW
jgi:hypothetical protein